MESARRCIEFTFSPTGGTKKAADAVAHAIAPTVVHVDLTDPNVDCAAFKFESNDVAVVAMPCFSGRIPAVALDRFERARGANAPCVVVCAYGNRAFGNSLREMADSATRAGFVVKAGVSAVTQNSVAPEYGTGHPNASDIERLASFGARIAESLSSEQPLDCTPLPGTSPRNRASAPPMVPRYHGDCRRCGLCAAACPTKAIDARTLHADGKRCCACMRCVAQCPDDARAANPLLLKLVALAIRPQATKHKECELYSA